ncbi:MAG: DUF433 domain-containing protein [Bacteroidetes bacterium QH_2_67_10]|jgi:uncharacterized protein (DUF433 family)|nr:MAG: DUF433 domain-containing protein [Bacteroidetes bacterium QH_2_67_10]
MNADDFASKDIRVMRGAVVFKGTRVPLERIVNYLKGNYTIDATLEDYPGVERAQVEAFLDYALQSTEADLASVEDLDAHSAR